MFGGTWERVKDVFILAAGDSYSAGSSGGSATKTLTTSNMPSHTHYAVANADASSSLSSSNRIGTYSLSSDYPYSLRGASSDATVGATSSTGSGTAFNIMPPYKTYYCWERIG